MSFLPLFFILLYITSYHTISLSLISCTSYNHMPSYIFCYTSLHLLSLCYVIIFNYTTTGNAFQAPSTSYSYFQNSPYSVAWSSATNVVAVGGILLQNKGLLMRSTNGGMTWVATAVSITTQ